MKIAVQDEDELALKKIRYYFKQHNKGQPHLTVTYFVHAEEMLVSLKDNVYDVFLLGSRIEGIRNMGCVVYIRNRNDKVISFEQFRSQISAVGTKLLREDLLYTGWFNRDRVVLNLNDIYYFERNQRETYVCTLQGKYRVNKNLGTEEEKLPDYQFARINQGELVNLYHVRSVEKETIYLDNGEIKYSSVRRVWQTIEKWENYKKNYKK